MQIILVDYKYGKVPGPSLSLLLSLSPGVCWLSFRSVQSLGLTIIPCVTHLSTMPAPLAIFGRQAPSASVASASPTPSSHATQASAPSAPEPVSFTQNSAFMPVVVVGILVLLTGELFTVCFSTQSTPLILRQSLVSLDTEHGEDVRW